MIDILLLVVIILLAFILYAVDKRVRYLLGKPEPCVMVWAKLVGGPADGRRMGVNLLRLPAKHMVPFMGPVEAKFYDDNEIIDDGTIEIGMHQYCRDDVVYLGEPIEYLYMGTNPE